MNPQQLALAEKKHLLAIFHRNSEAFVKEFLNNLDDVIFNSYYMRSDICNIFHSYYMRITCVVIYVIYLNHQTTL